ncbi:MAG: class I SAM-dependent methyltransferase [Candidatus Obscuribacterales bacterium]|nr:class I SAM-dependent methyltransferase [Candidatus Obscuribacterales bacterium]
MSNYQNLFDEQSAKYARFRPNYPDELFKFLRQKSPSNKQAWDAGTGSGQAAVSLAEHFEDVHASDSSLEQLSHGPKHARIDFVHAAAETCKLKDSSCDLVTAANAVHWFDRSLFYKEAERVLKKHGVLAIWCTGMLEAPKEQAEAVGNFYSKLEAFWSEPVKLVKARYKSIEFPFAEFPCPEFLIKANWSLEQVLGYYSSWSAIPAYEKENGRNPLGELRTELLKSSINNNLIEIQIPLYMRAGRKAD